MRCAYRESWQMYSSSFTRFLISYEYNNFDFLQARPKEGILTYLNSKFVPRLGEIIQKEVLICSSPSMGYLLLYSPKPQARIRSFKFSFAYCASQEHADSKIQNSKPTNWMRFSLHSIKYSVAYPSFRLRPTRGNLIVEHSSANETVLGSSRKLGGAVGRFDWR